MPRLFNALVIDVDAHNNGDHELYWLCTLNAADEQEAEKLSKEACEKQYFSNRDNQEDLEADFTCISIMEIEWGVEVPLHIHNGHEI